MQMGINALKKSTNDLLRIVMEQTPKLDAIEARMDDIERVRLSPLSEKSIVMAKVGQSPLSANDLDDLIVLPSLSGGSSGKAIVDPSTTENHTAVDNIGPFFVDPSTSEHNPAVDHIGQFSGQTEEPSDASANCRSEQTRDSMHGDIIAYLDTVCMELATTLQKVLHDKLDEILGNASGRAPATCTTPREVFGNDHEGKNFGKPNSLRNELRRAGARHKTKKQPSGFGRSQQTPGSSCSPRTSGSSSRCHGGIPAASVDPKAEAHHTTSPGSYTSQTSEAPLLAALSAITANGESHHISSPVSYASGTSEAPLLAALSEITANGGQE